LTPSSRESTRSVGALVELLCVCFNSFRLHLRQILADLIIVVPINETVPIVQTAEFQRIITRIEYFCPIYDESSHSSMVGVFLSNRPIFDQSRTLLAKCDITIRSLRLVLPCASPLSLSNAAQKLLAIIITAVIDHRASLLFLRLSRGQRRRRRSLSIRIHLWRPEDRHFPSGVAVQATLQRHERRRAA
jgi:hypothetical protein